MEESRLLQGLGLSLLHILFLQVSVLLVHNILAELWAHVSDTHINVSIKLLWLDYFYVFHLAFIDKKFSFKSPFFHVCTCDMI